MSEGQLRRRVLAATGLLRRRWRARACIAGLAALSVMASVLVRATPAHADIVSDTICLNDSSATLSFANQTLTWGDATTIMWNARLSFECGGEILHVLRNARDQVDGNGVGLGLSGSMVVTPLQTAQWTLRLTTPSGSKDIASATVTVNTPGPLTSGQTNVSITGNDLASRRQLVQAVQTPNTTVRIAGRLDLDLSGLDFVPVAPGVQIMGDRSLNPRGPRLFTTTRPRTLLKIGDNSDNVRMTGIRLEGGESDDPFSGTGPDDSDGIGVYASQHVEIDHNVIYHWNGAGVNVHDGNGADDPSYLGRLNQDTVEDNTKNVWMHDNYIHHNQHPSAANCLSGGGHAGGYGVVATDGAYVKIERNVFDWDRHSIAGDGKAGTGYVARDNLILQNGGVHFKCIDPVSSAWVFVLNPFAGLAYVVAQALDPSHIYHTHAIDMHGVDNCSNKIFTGQFNELGDHNCGTAGEYMDVEYNTILYTQGNGIHLRGYPQRALSSPAGTTKVGMDIKNNVFAHTEHDGGFITPGAMVANDIGLHDLGNTLGLNTFNDRKYCDLDRDGTNDVFIATGVSWWYLSSVVGQWVYLQRSDRFASEVRDVNGDGRCDVISPDGSVFYTPSGAPFDVTRPADQVTMIGQPVDLQLSQVGGGPLAWRAFGLPPGVWIDSGTGRILGTPTQAGSYTVKFRARDPRDAIVDGYFLWTINPNMVTVPNVYYRSSADASSMLQAAGLTPNPGGTIPTDDPRSTGKVVLQSPQAGVQVAQGTVVRLTFGRYVPNQCGPNPC